MGKLKDKKVVIFGGTSGIGLATVIECAQEGAEVWAIGRSPASIEKAKLLTPDGVHFEQLDVHDLPAYKHLFDSIGNIEHIVSTATGAKRSMKPFMEQTPEEFSGAFNKLWGYTNVIRHGAPYLNEGGSITLVSGVVSRKAGLGMSAISSVGNAVEGLVRSLALELAPMRVNVIAPGLIDTPLQDHMGDKKDQIFDEYSKSLMVKRIGQPSEVAQAILFVMTNAYTTGICIDVDGGMLLP